MFSEERGLAVFGSWVPRNMFGPKRDELCALYSSPNIIRVIKSRSLRWAGRVARMEAKKMHSGFVQVNMKRSYVLH